MWRCSWAAAHSTYTMKWKLGKNMVIFLFAYVDVSVASITIPCYASISQEKNSSLCLNNLIDSFQNFVHLFIHPSIRAVVILFSFYFDVVIAMSTCALFFFLLSWLRKIYSNFLHLKRGWIIFLKQADSKLNVINDKREREREKTAAATTTAGRKIIGGISRPSSRRRRWWCAANIVQNL